MLSVMIEVPPGELPANEFSQGHITLKGKYGSISSKGSVMVVLSLCQLLYHVRKFIVEDKVESELPLGMDSWFEPIL